MEKWFHRPSRNRDILVSDIKTGMEELGWSCENYFGRTEKMSLKS